MNYSAYLRSDTWQARRKAALKRAGGHYEVCHSRVWPEVHHNTYKNIFHEKPEDLIVLCPDCHEIFHSRLPKLPLWMRVKWWIEGLIKG